MNKFKSLLILVLILGLNYCNIFAQQPIPKPVMKLLAEGFYNDNNSIYAKISWYADLSEPKPTKFFVYYAIQKSENLNNYTKIAELEVVNNQNSNYYYFKHNDIRDFNGYYAVCQVNFVNGQAFISQPQFTSINNPNSQEYVQIYSVAPNTAKINSEYVYEVKAKTNTDSKINYYLAGDVNIDNAKIDKETGKFTWTPINNGTYTFTVFAALVNKPNITSYQKFTVTVGEQNTKYIKFTSTPAVYATPNKEYVYQIKATTNSDCAIGYEFMGQLPKNASFDQKTGTFRWIPQFEGDYISGSFKAFLTCDNKIFAIQQFYIKGYNGDNNPNLCSEIEGTIVYPDGAIPQDGKAIAWRISSDSKSNYAYSAYIKQGKFSMKVPDGTYVLEFDSPEFNHFWFENAKSFDLATRFSLKCNEKYSIIANAEKKPQPKNYNVSGKVEDESGNPLLAYVQFLPLEQSNNRTDYNKANTNFIVKTDANGNYKIALPNNFDYKALAFTKEDPSYETQYYNGVTSSFEADLIIVEKDIDGINFKLKKASIKTANYSGKVITDNGVGLKSLIYATLLSDNNLTEKAIKQYTTLSNEKGEFTFKNLPYGKYVLMSVPEDKQYVPGYYKIGQIATTSWKEATRVSISEIMTDVLCEIKHRARTGIKGIIQLEGTVTKNSKIALKDVNYPQAEAIPLAGAYVYVADNNNEIIDYGFTNELGKFILEELNAGEFRLYISAPGYEETSLPIQLDYQKNFKLSGLNIELNSVEALSVTEENQDIFRVYPTITSNSVNIEINSISGNSIISLFDISGNLLIAKNYQIFEGNNHYSVDLNHLSSGKYYIALQINNKKYISTINLIK